MTNDRLALMETFVRIVDAGSLSAAASQLGTSQPTISRRLRALEESLGLALLQRTTHAIQLTAAGERYVARAREMLLDWRGFEAELRGDDAPPEGTLRVVAPHAFGQEALVRPVADYLRRYPKMVVEWSLHDGIPRFVEDGVDCAIRVGATGSEGLVARKLFDVPRIVVAAPSLVTGLALERPARLAALPWLAIGTFYRRSVRLESERGAVTTLRIRPRFVTDSLFALRTAALEGLGIAVASEWVVRDDIARGALVHLVPRYRSSSLPVHLVYPRARFYAPKLRRFVDVVRAAFSASRVG